MTRLMRCLVPHLVLCAVLLAAGCAIVEIRSPGSDHVRVERRFGMISVTIEPKAGAVFVDSTSFGAMNAFEGLAVGYHRSSVVYAAPDSCQIALWISTSEQVSLLNDLLAGKTDVCVVNPLKTKGEKP